VNGSGIIPHAGAELLPWGGLALLLLGIWCLPNTQEILGESLEQRGEVAGAGSLRFLRWQPTLRWTLAISVAFFACFVMMRSASRFLYFQF